MLTDNQTVLSLLFSLLAVALFAVLRVARESGGFRGVRRLLLGALRAAQDVISGVVNVNTPGTPFAFVASGVTKYSRAVSLAGKRKVFFIARADTTAGASASMLITSQHSYDGGTNWLDSDAFTAITADGVYRKDPAAEVAPVVRFKMVSSGTFTTMNLNLWIAYVDPSIDARR